MSKFILYLLITMGLANYNYLCAQESSIVKEESNYFSIIEEYDNLFYSQNDSLKSDERTEFEKEYIRWKTLMRPRLGYRGSFDTYSLAINEYFKNWKRVPESTKSLQLSNDSFEFDEYLGPIGIPSTPIDGSKGSTGKGWVEDIFVDPIDPDIIFAGTHHSGLWKTTDGGDTWIDLTLDYPLIDGVINFTFDPNDDDIIYVLTGNSYPGKLGSYSNGIYKTTDGGITWDDVPVNVGELYYPSISDKIAPVKILTDPTSSNILYLITKSRILKSVNSGASWIVLRDTYDYLNNIFDEVYRDAEIDPNNPSIVFVSGNVILKSTNGGSSFSDLTSNVCGISKVVKADIAMHENYNGKVWFYISKTSYTKYLYMYVNGTSTFLGSASHSGDRTQNIEVSPNDENVIYLGGVINKIYSNGSIASISTTTLSDNSLRYGPGQWLHADCRDFCIYDAGTYDIVFTGHDGGVAKGYADTSCAPKFCWEQISDDSTDGLKITEFYGLTVAKNDPEFIIGGAQDLSFFIYDHGTWKHANGGDGGSAVIDYENNDITYQMSSFIYSNYLKKMTQRGLSDDGDVNNSDIGSNLFTKLTMHPIDPKILYYPSYYMVGGAKKGKLMKIANANTTHENYDISPTNDHGQYSAFAISNINPDVMYAGCDKVYWQIADRDSLFWKSDDGGVTWTSISENHSNGFIAHYPTDIEINPIDSDELWVCFAGAINSSNKVLHSEDGGENWEFLSTGYPSNIPAHCLAYNFLTKTLFVGTEVGVFSWNTEDPDEWIAHNSTLPKIVTGIEVTDNYSKIVVSTYGYGIWRATMPAGICFDETILSVNTSQTWSDDETICQNINVENYSTLTITGNITLSIAATITVEGYCSLVIDSGTLINGNIVIKPYGSLTIKNDGNIQLNENDNVNCELGSVWHFNEGRVDIIDD